MSSETKNVEPPQASLREVFNTNYSEFAGALMDTFPELAAPLGAALELSDTQRWARFQAEVLPTMADVQGRNKPPTMMLPGVQMPAGEWDNLSPNNRKVILEYLGLMCSCILFEMPDSATGQNWDGASKWFEGMMGSWKDKMAGIDFKSMTEKVTKLFGISTDGGIPSLPEKFMKGHIAKLAEELMKEFKPEDFGLDPELMKECESNPTKAFDILMKVYMNKPGSLQAMITRVGKRLQQKFASGALRPEQIVAEAEELMKTFQENPEFVNLMESFKSAFGFEDMDMARAAGKEQSARMNIVKERLKKKMDAKKGANSAATHVGADNMASANAAAEAMAKLLMEEAQKQSAKSAPQQQKKRK
jgi:hypothetical protein